jgi:peptide/nickel transport system substrate-binding protein
LLQILNLPRDLRLADVLYTPRQYHRGEITEPIPYAPDTATALLTNAGWRDTDGDGVRDRGGRPFRFTALAGSAEDEAAGVYVQAALRRVGVAMRLERLEMEALRERVRLGAFEAAFFPFWNHVTGHARWLGYGAQRELEMADFAASIHYRNVAVARLLAAAQQTADPEEQDRIYRQLAPLVYADVPITFLFPRVQAYAVHRRVRGLQSPFHGDPVSSMETLWLERR